MSHPSYGLFILVFILFLPNEVDLNTLSKSVCMLVTLKKTLINDLYHL